MPFELTPHKLVYGGEALGYHRGRPVLVSQALPGERLEVEPVRTAKGVVHARLLRVLTPSPQRVDAPCPHYGRCGGCQYQHLGAERQTSAKQEIMREPLRRLGKITWSGEIPVHSAQPWNYRNQARLKVARQPDGSVGLGFFEAESHRLFPMDACLILSPRLNAVLKMLRGAEWSSRLGECEEVEMLADDGDERVMLTLRGRLKLEGTESLAADCLARLPGVAGVALEQGGGWRVFGQPALCYSVGEFQYQVSPGSFFQASRFLVPELVTLVTALESDPSVAPNPDRHRLALDLFAGVGLFTLPLAKRFERVIAVEANSRATADLEANLRARSLQNVRVVSQTVLDFLRRFAQAEPDLVVLDPPRAGAGIGTLELLAALRPRRFYYVSCSPPTLARDLALLVARGYQLNSVELFDFFPQTYHLECLAKLTRIDCPA